MASLSLADLEALARVLPDLYAANDPVELPARVVAAARALVPGIAHGYNRVDRATGAVETTAEPAMVVSPERVKALAERVAEHPIMERVRGTGETDARAISHLVGRDEFRRRALYGDVYRPLDVEDQLGISLVRPSAIVGIVVSRDRWGFSERERLLLDLLRPHVAAAHDRLSALTAARQAVDAAGVGIVQLGPDGAILAADARAGRAISAAFERWRAGDRRLPSVVEAWARAQAARLAADPSRAPSDLIVEGARARLRARFAPATAVTGPVLAIEAEARGSRGGDGLAALTPREQDVLALLEAGASNREIAEALVVSLHTVHRHLQNVYGKLGVRSRTAAVAHARRARDAGAPAAPRGAS